MFSNCWLARSGECASNPPVLRARGNLPPLKPSIPLNNNVIVAIFERVAAHYVGKRKGVNLTKTVKFIDMPTIDQLRRQLTMLTQRLDLIYRAERSLDVEMDL